MGGEERELNYYFVGNIPLFDTVPLATIEECYEYLKDQTVLSLDIETTRKYGGQYDAKTKQEFGKKVNNNEGLSPYLSEVVMVQIGTIERQYIIDARCVSINILLSLLIDTNITIVGQNLKFEYVHFLHNYGIRLNNVYDTMIAEKVLFNGLGLDNSLKALNQRYLGITVDKTTALEFLSIEDKPFTRRQMRYGAEDVLYPLLIREKQLLDIQKKNLSNCISLEMLFLLVLGDIEYKGMHFNRAKWLDTYSKNKEEFILLQNKLDSFVEKHFPNSIFINRQLDIFNTEPKCNISWTSSTQVIKLFRYLGICPMEKSKSTGELAYTVNAKVLMSSLNTTNKDIEPLLKEFVLLYLEFKEKEQSCTTFGKDFLKHVNPITNRLHSNYNQIINTGRISSSNPNLQNIPAEHGFRYAFDCPDGWKIVNADYSGQEQIILANKSEDKDLIAFYEKDLGDMHSYIASKIFTELADLSLDDIKKYHSDKRQMAKAAGFAINYGGTGFTIANNLGVDQSVGDFVYDSYFKAFPGLKNFFDKVKKESRRNGYILIDPISGRKYWYDKSNMHKVDKLAQNYPMKMGVITVM